MPETKQQNETALIEAEEISLESIGTDTEKAAEERPDGKTEKEKKKSGKKKKGKAEKPRKKPSVWKALLSFLIKLLVIALIIWALYKWVGGVSICHTTDMFPSLRDGDLVITYKLGELRNEDVIAFYVKDKLCYGRIIGEPGDVIYIDAEGSYTVNGTRPYETIFYDTKVRESDSMTYPYTVQEGEFFVLSDAREQGLDSRNFGPVKEVEGKVVLTIRRRGF